MRAELAHIDTWIFDLDNSLYPASCDLFALIDIRMTDYIARMFGCPRDEAYQIQKGYFRDHGTTLAGLMRERHVDPHEFLEFVHDIDLARLTADPDMLAALDRLPGRKFVFTNGDENYARRVLDKLGLANAFDGLHDIHAMEYVPKPDPRGYAEICARHGIAPARALFADDMVRNLAPAKALGMTTVWVDNGSEQAAHCRDDSIIDYCATDVAVWLHEILGDERA
ncbi:pyrimidine 5'-nucleotidase [Sphingosinicella sp. YJ22]|uniref:pyrimidine 5'-nucleotidase n=1 Tax=Sphingosinicella sp. YJ22 TaxID=1104780 RepID=UPI00140A0847|nr:pyrimidine 5'-nucleotidase [Sphingosinicella sp. YJ22]